MNFSLLCKPWYNYEQQKRINPHRIKMAGAAMVHFGLDLGKFVRWMGGEYTGFHCDVQRTLAAVRPYIIAKDYNHIMRIFLDGCPAELMFTEPLDNKLKGFDGVVFLVVMELSELGNGGHLPSLTKFLDSRRKCHGSSLGVGVMD